MLWGYIRIVSLIGVDSGCAIDSRKGYIGLSAVTMAAAAREHDAGKQSHIERGRE